MTEGRVVCWPIHAWTAAGMNPNLSRLKHAVHLRQAVNENSRVQKEIHQYTINYILQTITIKITANFRKISDKLPGW